MSYWSSLLKVLLANRDAAPPSRVRSLSSDALHVFVLTSFSIAQPVYDRLSQRFSFLFDQNIPAAVVWIMVLLLSLGAPAILVLLEAVADRYRREFRDVLHSLIVFVLLVLSALLFCVRIEFLPGEAVLGMSLAIAGAATWWYFESRRVRAVATLAAPGIILFPILFLIQFQNAQSTLGPAASRSPQWKPLPIVLLVFDEFSGTTLMTPEREIDAERFPNFAALARQSTWFRSATSVNPNTEFAVPAILSGRLPTVNYSPGTHDLPQNLFSVLRLVGDYEVAAFEPVSNLARLDDWSVENQDVTSLWRQATKLADTLGRVYLFQMTPIDFRSHLPLIPRTWFGWRESSALDRQAHRGVFHYGWNDQRDMQFQHFLKCLDATSDSTLFFGHFLLPHVPWCFLPSGHHYIRDSKKWELCIDSGNETANEFVATQNQQRYLLQVMYVDHLIGKLMARLKESGLLDRCLLIVTADHGTSFRVGQPRRSLVPGNQADILSVPLFIKLPHQAAGQVSDRLIESIDILPTYADVVGITLDSPPDGWSAFDTARPERQQVRSADYLQTLFFDPAVIRDSTTPAEIRRRFGAAVDPQALFRIGPIPELVGRSVQSLKQSTAAPIELRLTRFGDTVEANSQAIVPCYFEGSALSPSLSQAPHIIAVAINGTIRAVTKTMQNQDIGNHWSAMVSERAFRVGKNDVRFFVVTGSDWQLTPCVTTGPDPSDAQTTDENAQPQ